MGQQPGQPLWFWFARERAASSEPASAAALPVERLVCTCTATCSLRACDSRRRQDEEENKHQLYLQTQQQHSRKLAHHSRASLLVKQKRRARFRSRFSTPTPIAAIAPAAALELFKNPSSDRQHPQNQKHRHYHYHQQQQQQQQKHHHHRHHHLLVNLITSDAGWSSSLLLASSFLVVMLLLSGELGAPESAAHAQVVKVDSQKLSVSQQLDRLLLEQLPLQNNLGGSAAPKRVRRVRPLDYVKRRPQHRRRRHQQLQHSADRLLAADNADRPLVETKRGRVRGITQKIFTGKFVDAFLGIPYAQPPVGKWRFRHPQPVLPWSGELDASRMSSSCYQINDTFFGPNFLGTLMWNANTPLSEDCLFLNIWSPFGLSNASLPSSGGLGRPSSKQQQQQQPRSFNPKSGASSSRQQLRPVLVWIFGGGFYSGTSSLTLYEGGVLASEEDIVVVSLNYRVSALGFLYFGRPDAPGNSGLFDQLLALQWISDNIDQFGGDPARVTIFGESAGAVSIAFHLLSPLSRNLFSQAILQSGAATCPWGFMDTSEIIENGLQLAQLVNCPSNKSDLDSVLECLNRVDPMVLVSQEVGKLKSVLNFPFVPVVDGTFLLENPSESLMKSNFKRAKILLGSNFDEGNSWLIYLPEFNSCPPSDEDGASQPAQKAASASSSPSSSSSPSPAGLDGGGFDQAFPPLDYYSSVTHQQHPSSSLLESLSLQYRQPSAGEAVVASSSAPELMSASFIKSAGQASLHQQVTADAGSARNEQQQQQQPRICTPKEYPSLTREDFLRLLSDDVNPYANHPLAKEAIVFEYSNWNNPSDLVSMADALDKIVGDYYFTCHVNEFAQRYAQASNSVFMYHFRQRASVSPWPKWMGVLHGDELSFVFGEPLNTQHFNYTPKEIELSKRIMNYWANFAKYGNPTKTGENSSMPEKWPEYGDKRQYFELHAEYARVGRGPRAKQCAFWAHYLPRLLDSFERNECPSKQPSHHLPRNTLEQVSYQRLLMAASQASTTFSWPLIVSLIVILVLSTILAFLVYAKRSGKLHINFTSSTSNSNSNNNNTDTNNNTGN